MTQTALWFRQLYADNTLLYWLRCCAARFRHDMDSSDMVTVCVSPPPFLINTLYWVEIGSIM